MHGFSRDLVFISLRCADIVFADVPLAWCRKGGFSLWGWAGPLVELEPFNGMV